MKIEELIYIEKDIYQEYQNALFDARLKYCKENSNVKIGDIVKDHIGSVLVEKISMHNSSTPCLIYYGLELKKDLSPRKDKSKRSCYQTNIINEQPKSL